MTGSGKTEVYLAMVQRTLEMGKGAIILVPEIALTPQMVRWFHSRFGENTAVLHSRLTDGQRYDEWRRIRRDRPGSWWARVPPSSLRWTNWG